MKSLQCVTCDQCGYDLTTTGNCEDYRLVLGNESKTPWYVAEGRDGGAVTSMAIRPPLSRAHHFCDISCLAMWVAIKYPDSVEHYDRLQAHRKWLKERCPPPNVMHPGDLYGEENSNG